MCFLGLFVSLFLVFDVVVIYSCMCVSGIESRNEELRAVKRYFTEIK